jgi:hypothetical protein
MYDTNGGTILNLDIWHEIIRYYGLHPPNVKTKKATLLSLALVSRRLTPLAQAEIWKTVNDISHVVKYIDYIEELNIIDNVYPKVCGMHVVA